MKKRVTISEAIAEVMRDAGRALSPQEVHQLIVQRKLYTFHAQDPGHVVKTQIRRHCKDLDFPTAEATKYFGLTAEGLFYALKEPLRTGRSRKRRRANSAGVHTQVAKGRERVTVASSLKALRDLHQRHRRAVKERILRDLKRLAPVAFEHFAKRLLEVYGFANVCVTGVTRDGGIDGHGKLRVGLAHMGVAFQCKRWTKTNVGRPEVDKFRGAIQGEFEQGIFFTTATFAVGAKAVSLKRGAVPVILIDGPSIADLMIEKCFGVEMDSLPVYTYGLDLVLGERDPEPGR